MSTVIRDAIWGDIELGSRELAVIDTPAFQRLRRVRQLGFTDLVYPGANHTRFEHSLGVLHVARLAARRLGIERPELHAAALLHDIGHYPYSHAVEELEVDAVRHHERIARDIVVSEPVASILRGEWHIEPQDVASLIGGDVPGGELGVIRTVLDSGLDVDKLDYLVRDARGANVPYGVVDVQRLVGSLVVVDGRLAVDEKGIAALESLIFAKHLMFATVYWHHTCRAATAMLLRALQDALDAGAIDAAELEHADDSSLIALLHNSPGRALADRIHTRRLYKRVAEFGPSDDDFEALEKLWFEPSRRREVEDAWARDAGLRDGEVLLDIPEPRTIGVDLPIHIAGELVEWDRAADLATADLARMQSRARRIRVFASEPDRVRGPLRA